MPVSSTVMRDGALLVAVWGVLSAEEVRAVLLGRVLLLTELVQGAGLGMGREVQACRVSREAFPFCPHCVAEAGSVLSPWDTSACRGVSACSGNSKHNLCHPPEQASAGPGHIRGCLRTAQRWMFLICKSGCSRSKGRVCRWKEEEEAEVRKDQVNLALQGHYKLLRDYIGLLGAAVLLTGVGAATVAV